MNTIAHPRSRRCVAALAALLPALALAACGASRPGPGFTLDIPEGTRVLAVDVNNFRGSVSVRADGADDGMVRVTPTYHLAPRVDDDGEDAYFELFETHAAIESADGRGVLRVSTESPVAWDADHWVELDIVMPRCDGVHIDNRGGMVDVVGAGGATHITNRGGSIEFRTGRIMNAPVTLTTSDGDIWYQVPLGSEGRLDLETLRGEVGVKDDSGGAQETYALRNRYQGEVGSGDNAVVARTSQGNIRVWVIEDPMALVRTFNRELADPRDAVGLQGPRRFRRNLPDDHPEVSEVPLHYHYD